MALAVAVVIGVTGAPPGEPASGLLFAESDAVAVAALLRARGYDVICLTGLAASRAAILTALSTQHRQAGPLAPRVLYFSGSAAVDAYYAQSVFLLPADADPLQLPQSALVLDDLVAHFPGSGLNTLALFDCSAAATTGGPGAPGAAVNRQAAASLAGAAGERVLFICAALAPARESPFLARGRFTHWLLAHWPWGRGLLPDPATLREEWRRAESAPVPAGPRPAIESRILGAHARSINAVAFAPGGMLLAAASSDGSVSLWDVIRGTLERTLIRHSDWVQCLAFAPDGT